MGKNLLNKKKSGFTLIELIVVIAIIGVLAAVAIPRFAGTQANAANKAHLANYRTLESAAALAVANEGAPKCTITWKTTTTTPVTTYDDSSITTGHKAIDYIQGNGPTIPNGATKQPNGNGIGNHTVYVVTITEDTGAISVTTE